MNSWARKWGEQIMRSRQYASAAALVFSFFAFFDLPTGWLSTVIIALVTYQNGPRQGLNVTAWAILPAVAMMYLGQYPVFIYMLGHYLLVLGLAAVIRKQNSWVEVLQLSAVIGMISVVAIHFFAADLPATWLTSQLTAVSKEYKNLGIFNLRGLDLDAWIKDISYFATGIWVFVTLLKNLAILFIARWWQSGIVPAVSLQKEGYAVRIPYLTSCLVLFSAAGIYFNSGLFFNLTLVSLLPFILAGVSVFHAFAATKKNSNSLVFVFYTVFVFFSPYLAMLLSLIGWMDSFINFRKRFVINNVVEE